MRPLICCSATLTALALLAGCGSSSSSATTTVTTPVVSKDDAAQSTAASGAVGAATDAGVSELFAGGTAAKLLTNDGPVVAWQSSPDAIMHDGPSPLAALVKSVDTAPSPAVSSGMITFGADYGGAGASGSVPYEIDTTGLPANYYHVVLTFSPTNTLTLHTENGDTAVINGGELDIYVTGTLVSSDGSGNWDYKLDHYSTMPTANPITVNVTTVNNVSWVTRITGLRHGAREYVRSKNTSGAQPVITLTESFTIDGNFAGFPTPTGTATAAAAVVANPGNGPSLLDTNGAAHLFTKWTFASTTANAVHSFVWDRYATFGLTYVRTGSTALSVTVNSPFDNYYITKDGTQVGPLSPTTLSTQFTVTSDLTQTAQDR